MKKIKQVNTTYFNFSIISYSGSVKVADSLIHGLDISKT